MMTNLLQRDVRSCLHMLQFVHRRIEDRREILTQRGGAVSMRFGRKFWSSGGMASDTSIFQSLRELFCVSRKACPQTRT